MAIFYPEKTPFNAEKCSFSGREKKEVPEKF